MTINEMRQRVAMCAVTLEKLNGVLPCLRELCSALGEEYTMLAAEYLHARKPATAA